MACDVCKRLEIGYRNTHNRHTRANVRPFLSIYRNLPQNPHCLRVS